MAFFYLVRCFRFKGLILRFFGFFSATLTLTDARKNTTTQRGHPSFFRIAMKINRAKKNGCQLSKIMARKGFTGRVFFSPKAPNFARSIVVVRWQRRKKKRKKRELDVLPHVDAIVAIRLVSNHPAYWPIHCLNTKKILCTDLTTPNVKVFYLLSYRGKRWIDYPAQDNPYNIRACYNCHEILAVPLQ